MRRATLAVLIIATILSRASLALGQDSNGTDCPDQKSLMKGVWYAEAVWQQVLPPNSQDVVITITLSTNLASKIILSASDKTHFKLS
jgi:hypothetical protein